MIVLGWTKLGMTTTSTSGICFLRNKQRDCGGAISPHDFGLASEEHHSSLPRAATGHPNSEAVATSHRNLKTKVKQAYIVNRIDLHFFEFMRFLFELIDTLISKTGMREYSKYLRAKERVAELKREGHEDKDLEKAEKAVEKLKCPTLEGGPFDGQPVAKQLVRANIRYHMLPKLTPVPIFCVYEHHKASNRFIFVRSFGTPVEFDEWQRDHPQQHH